MPVISYVAKYFVGITISGTCMAIMCHIFVVGGWDLAHICTSVRSIYMPGNGIYMNCGGHISFLLSTMQHFINGLERRKMKEAVN